MKLHYSFAKWQFPVSDVSTCFVLWHCASTDGCLTTPICRHNASTDGRCETEAKRCPQDWLMFASSCYYISAQRRSWDDSRQHCLQNGADLVIIHSTQEQVLFIRNNLLRRIFLTERHFNFSSLLFILGRNFFLASQRQHGLVWLTERRKGGGSGSMEHQSTLSGEMSGKGGEDLPVFNVFVWQKPACTCWKGDFKWMNS